MHLQYFNQRPSNRRRMAAAALDRAQREREERAREFQRLCGAIMVLADNDTPVTVNNLTGTYGFAPIFLQSRCAEAARWVADKRPDLAEKVDHMNGAQ
ncbi:hypothetical protein [Ferrovibrio xuzhouensis]|uniref:Uncharacterized protein n=1 Tax=Ferrovibrio xuzhouensis TaxID=1576914 RepID=A0ABV7VC41_9PROT